MLREGAAKPRLRACGGRGVRATQATRRFLRTSLSRRVREGGETEAWHRPPEELRRCAGGSGRPVRGSEQGRAGADLHFGQVERCHESQRLRSWRHVTSLRSWRHVTSWGRALPPPRLGGALFFASPLGAPGDWPSSLGSTLITDPRPTQPGSCWETLALGASPPGVTVGARMTGDAQVASESGN